MKKRSLLILSSLILIIVIAVTGTFAYLTDRDAVVNSFTIGRVAITLDEADVDAYGVPLVDGNGNPAKRVKNNEYKLLPGVTYVKDPTITVEANSVSAYIRMKVVINCMAELDALFAPEGADLITIFNGYDANNWICAGEARSESDNTVTYEFRYKTPVSAGAGSVKLDALFDSFTLPGTFTVEELETLEGLTITVYGHAIQSAAFVNEEAAWVAFDEQVTAPVNP